MVTADRVREVEMKRRVMVELTEASGIVQLPPRFWTVSLGGIGLWSRTTPSTALGPTYLIGHEWQCLLAGQP